MDCAAAGALQLLANAAPEELPRPTLHTTNWTPGNWAADGDSRSQLSQHKRIALPVPTRPVTRPTEAIKMAESRRDKAATRPVADENERSKGLVGVRI